MKALSALRSAINQGSLVALTALIAITPLVYPEVMFAASGSQTEGESALVFEIKDPSVLKSQNKTLTSSLTLESVLEQDPLVPALREYLKKHNSPLAEYAEQIVTLPQWERALAISWVESNFGRRCADNNCSGIGVAPGHPLWRKYQTKLDWFKDMTVLLEKPMYKDKYNTCKKMRGIYVYPGSNNWVWGCEKKLNELMKITDTANQQRTAMHSNMQLAMIAGISTIKE